MENNPIKFSSKNMDALTEAHNMLLSALNEYAKIKSLSEEDVLTLKHLINNQFNKKKIEYFLQDKVFHYSNYIDNIINLSFNQDRNPAKDKTYSSVFYLKHTKELVTR